MFGFSCGMTKELTFEGVEVVLKQLLWCDRQRVGRGGVKFVGVCCFPCTLGCTTWVML